MCIKDYVISFQETPDEISLCIRVAGCTNKCKGCHSPELCTTKDTKKFTDTDLKQLLNKYTGLFTCVLFMGGDQYHDELVNLLDLSKGYGYKTCLYTGLEEGHVSETLKSKLDYLKVGKWDASLGGLESRRTNQKFLDLKNNKVLNYKFWSKDSF